MSPHWLARPPMIRRLWLIFIAVLVLTVLAEIAIERHPAIGFDGFFGFNAWFGFGACVAMVLLARLLGMALKRRDDFYDR
jgi:hypothetical protein